ncbi:adenylate/guanylate cyclase domain-containing protein [Brevibacterium renqingii]|uniref:adenylate/guanylate cyclase domain-containing protein n=1 Tax=Brevibacterium renqingii TaxID=2776916 RepID=UPI001ADEC33A|nr:adenylate/guanylate cyclase domain-containing protein [Brevibacterium renqingii]
MMAVSDFTAGFDVVGRERLGSAEVGEHDGQTPEGSGASEAASQNSAAGDAEARDVDRSHTDPTRDVEVAADEAATAEAESSAGPNSLPIITDERLREHTADAAPARAGASPASVHGIEHGDDDLVRGLETAPAGSSDDTAAAERDADAEGDFFGGLYEDPRTAALQIVEEGEDEDNAADFDDTIYETRTAAERLEEILLDGKRVLDRREAAKLGGISTVSARKMWRALGMSQTDEGEKAYTVSDAHALRMWAKPVADGLIDQDTALSLARAIGQTTDRLVVWQMETLVEFLTEEKGLSDPEARRDALQVVEDMIDPLQKMLTYSWRRNLAEVMGRLNVNVSDGLAMDNRQGWYDSSMPLARAVGFIDLVSFTRLSQQMEPRQLANMVQEFQGMAYNIVATGGGRVIKTVGDEVFFAASTPLAGAEIAMTLMERVTAAEDLPQARVGFVWGRVLSRLGDIFGSSVNLAARLTAVADPGTIFTDEETARVLSASDDYVFEPRQSISLHGLGETAIGEMKRGTAARMRLDIDDEGES